MNAPICDTPGVGNGSRFVRQENRMLGSTHAVPPGVRHRSPALPRNGGTLGSGTRSAVTP